MALLTYSPQRISVSVAGLFDIEGFAQGTFVEITKEVTPYQYQSAMDGQTSRTFTYDANFSVKIHLAQTSSSNDILNSLHAVDLVTQLGKVPFLIRDKNGSTMFFSPTAWIENYPDVGFSDQMETRVWTFKCSDCVLTVAGAGEANLLNQLIGLAPGAADLFGVL